MQDIKINTERLWQSIMKMGEIGGTELGGCCRLALTELDKQARDLFIDWCTAAGCSIEIDKMGNIFATRSGSDSALGAISTGSHLDTQPCGGKFDGIYGCLAGLEVIRTLNEHNIETKRPVEVSVWTNEEGSRFAPAMISSGVYSGKFDLEWAWHQCDSDGVSLLEALKGIDYLGESEVGNRAIHQFYELHIEQGPVLEREQLQIGVVTGVLGMRWYDVNISGNSAHAGPTPMDYRQDALYAQSKMYSQIFELALADGVGDARCTAGEIAIEKASRNVVAGGVNSTLDLRHSQQASLDQLETDARAIINDVENLTKTQIEINKIWDSPPLAFDKNCVNAVEQVVAKSGLSYKKMVSGAGHDAVNIASVTPTAMIFIPSIGGISHNEKEYSSPEQLSAGCQVLFEVMRAQASV